VLVLRTLGAPQRHRLRGRRPQPLEGSEPEPVPSARATIVRARPFDAETDAEAWLSRLRAEADEAEAELAWAIRLLNRARHARRTAAADPYAGDVSAGQALVARVGYGPGEAVAEGRFAAALQLPLPAFRRARRSMETPDERFAAILGAREQPLAAEELVLRARADLEAGRMREAALEARTALEALLAELEPAPQDDLQGLEEPLQRAARAALGGEPEPAAAEEVAAAVAAMERALRRRRLMR
jgi:hypothetical protein